MIRKPGRVRFVLTGLLLLVTFTTAAVDLEEALKDAPQEILDILDATQYSLSEGRFLIVGRVAFSDDRQIEGGDCPEVYASYLRDGDLSLAVFSGGWFASRSAIEPYYGDAGTLVLRAIGHEPVDIPIALGDPIIFIDEVVLVPETEYLITGVATYADGSPIQGITVDLTFPFSSYCYDYLQSVVTDETGTFEFTGLSSAVHRVILGAPHGFEMPQLDVTPHKPDVDDVVEMTMYYSLQVVIEYAYQANGSRTLTGPDMLTGTATWVAREGFDFEDGKPEYYEQDDLRDLELLQVDGELFFRVVYVSGENGFYRVSDAGSGFDDVTEADESGYLIGRVLCEVDGVYVVRTHTEGHYAKFIVRAIEHEP